MRAYLLGILDDTNSAAVEQKYFSDRAFFLFVREEETRLIEDHLAARLSPAESRQFEDRYLNVPELRARVEELRVRGGEARMRPQPVLGRWVLAAATALVCAGGIVFWQRHGPAHVSPASVPVAERPLLATLFLSPGIPKSEAGGTAEFVRVGTPGSVRLVLELPGESQPVPCLIAVSAASAEGGWKEVWSTHEPVVSTPSRGGQQISIVRDTAVLAPGDYLVRATGRGQQVSETYVFHVRPR